MPLIEYIRKAKCKDCDFIRYYYKGERKLHICKIDGKCTRLNDYACSKWKVSTSGVPEKL